MLLHLPPSIAPRSSSDTHQEDLTAAVDLIPYSLVNSKAFRDLLHKEDASLVIPSRKHLANRLISDKAATVRRSLIELFDSVDDICLTMDLWSSHVMGSFVGITGHFVADHRLRSVMQTCSSFKASHIAGNISAVYECAAATYGLASNVDTIVTDNSPNMANAFSLPGMDELVGDWDNDLWTYP